MGSEWEDYYLSEIGSLARGKSKHRPRWAEHLYGGEYPFIQTGEIRNTGKFVTKYNQTYSEAGLAQSKLWDKDTLCITIAANIAEVALLSFPACFPDSVLGFRADKDKSSVDFVYYLLKNFQEQIQVFAIGSVQDNINLGTFEKIKFKIPPLPTQRAIAHILGSLDDKIALLRQMNETLEQMAQALFQSWFVDFDPVIDKALAAGHDIPEQLQARAARRQALGDKRKPLPAEIADLFPDAFTFHEEMGWVPDGWGSGKIKDIGTNPRETIQPDAITPETPYIGLQNMPQKSIALAEWQSADDVASNKYVFKKGDILFGKLRPYFHKVGVAPIDGICSTDILVVKPKRKFWLSLLLGHVSSEAFISYTTNSSSGTRMPRTNWKDMGNYSIAIPATKLSDYLSTLFQNYISQIDSNIHQIHSLTTLRDTLLPKLISGEVRVGEG